MDESAVGKYRKDLEFLRLAARQTEVDFSRLGYEIKLVEQPLEFRELCLQLETEILQICRQQGHRLEALFYHIDIPARVMHPFDACKNPVRTAEVILQRELIKVVIRKLYSPDSGR